MAHSVCPCSSFLSALPPPAAPQKHTNDFFLKKAQIFPCVVTTSLRRLDNSLTQRATFSIPALPSRYPMM